MGKIIFVAIAIGIAYAWHNGMLDPYLDRVEVEAPPPPSVSHISQPNKRYENAEQTPQQRCAAARAKLEELETAARGRSGVIDPNARNAALDQARQAVQEKCPS